jgi:hypothetical protein
MDEADIEGNSNPNLGRPYIQETARDGNRSLMSEVEAFRASAFLDHDFREKDGFWREVLGRHILNIAFTSDTVNTDERAFSRYVYGDELLELFNYPRFNNRSKVGIRYYAGDSLVGASSLAEANMNPLLTYITPEAGNITLRYFDNTWTGTGVNPGDPWTNPAGQTSTQSTNPANYVGWTDGTFNVINALSGNQADLDLATHTALLQENTVDSQIFSWQAYLWDNILVATFGWRKDESDTTILSAPTRTTDNGADVNPSTYNLRNGDKYSLEVQSRNYSLVAHLNKIPVLENLPFNVSLTYNEGENFNPSAGRIDILGNALPAPQGSTEEYGVILSTKDNRYSLRVQAYETSILNADSSSVSQAYRLDQFLGAVGGTSAYNVAEGNLRQDYEALAEQPDFSIDDQENLHLPAWRSFESAFAQAFPEFIDQWLAEGSYNPSNNLTRFEHLANAVEDTVSEGYEIELTANPTDQLRLILNASKTEAVRDNAPGRSLVQVYNFIQDAMFDGTTPTEAGLMRSSEDWQNQTMADFWFDLNWSNYQFVQQLNGQLAPELVEWRVNGIANYTFADGFLDGFNVGGAYRWESGATIGYPRYFDEFGLVAVDVNNPIERGSTDQVDFWIGYNTRIYNGKIDWGIQLNIYNIFGSNELIPVKANPDGAYAQYRIKEGRSFRVSTSFRF